MPERFFGDAKQDCSTFVKIPSAIMIEIGLILQDRDRAQEFPGRIVFRFPVNFFEGRALKK